MDKKQMVRELVKSNPRARAEKVDEALALMESLRKRGVVTGGYRLDHPFGSQSNAAASDEEPDNIQTEIFA